MDCRKFSEYFYRFLDDELDDEAVKEEMAQHLIACPICAMGFEKEKKFNALIKGHLIKEKAPYELREAVVAGIEREGKQSLFTAFLGRFRPIPSLGVLAACVVILAFIVTSLYQPFPVFAESINRHVDHLQGGYPIEINSHDMNEVLAWFEGKLDFEVSRPHLDSEKVTLQGARICHLKGHKVAYFIYEKDGEEISAFVMDYDQLILPRVAKSQIKEGKNNRVYINEGNGYSSVFCYHKRIKTGCIIVSDMPQEALLGLMG